MENDNQTPYLTLSENDSFLRVNWRELWQFRYLIFYLGWRNIAVRYKQTYLGFLWAIIQPLVTIVVYTLIFGNLADFATGNIPYPVFSFAALLPFFYFSNGLTAISRSLVQNSRLISKVYFPRIVIPLSTMLAPLIDFVISFVLLLVLMLIAGVSISSNIILLPMWILLLLLFSLSIGIWLSGFSVRYRDIIYVLPFLIQMLQFLSPVVYGIDIVPEEWRLLYSLNPLTGIIEGFRWSILGTELTLGFVPFLASFGISLILLITGIIYFNYIERDFADII